jgi:hypothetical protein
MSDYDDGYYRKRNATSNLEPIAKKKKEREIRRGKRKRMPIRT